MNIRPYIILNGKNSQEIQGLMISELAPISKPQVRTQVETVDGRDGDIITPLGFSAYDKVITIGLTYGYDIDEIIEFFNSAGVVTFSNEPDKYYRYAIYEQIDFERLIRFKTAEVVLHVQPFKYSTTEETESFNISSGEDITVVNDGNIDARPNLIIIGEGEVDFSLNGSQILSIDFGETEQPIIIDSEDMNAYAAENAIKDVKADFLASQAEGTPTPSAPISIDGVSAVSFTRTGKNLFDPTNVINGYLNNQAVIKSTATTRIVFVKCNPNTTYTVSKTAGQRFQVAYCDSLPEAEVQCSGMITNSTASSTTITTGANAKYLVAYIYHSSYDTITAEQMIASVQIELGSTATDYEAPTIVTKTINLGGTYYGGKVEAVTGKIKKTMSEPQDLSLLNWKATTSPHIFYATFTGKKVGYASKIICEQYSFYEGYFSSLGNYQISGNSTYQYIYIRNDDCDTKEELIAALSGCKCCCELATPVQAQASNTAEIKALLGVNNIFSDAGDVTVTYKSRGVLHTETGSIVSFELYNEDMKKGVLLNRMITGDYDKIRLKKGDNTLCFTGNARQLLIDKYSRWI